MDTEETNVRTFERVRAEKKISADQQVVVVSFWFIIHFQQDADLDCWEVSKAQTLCVHEAMVLSVVQGEIWHPPTEITRKTCHTMEAYVSPKFQLTNNKQVFHMLSAQL